MLPIHGWSTRILWQGLRTLMLVSVLAGCAADIKPVRHGPAMTLTSPPDAFLQAQSQARESTGLPSVTLLNTGQEAFMARAALIETANQRIDAQYYIWNDDASGRYLASRLVAAADRGVVVRLLLDDINIAGKESLFVLLNAHPNVRVRIFNPSRSREGFGRWLSFITDFDRINRRMHNKTFVVDGVVGIAGGRNIGDEYFDQHPSLNFKDRDVMVLGALAGDMTDNFGAYWDSPWTLPLEQLYQQSDVTDSRLYERVQGAAQDRLKALVPEDRQAARAYLAKVFAEMISAPAELVFDAPPEDPEAPAVEPKRTAEALYRLVEEAQSEVLIESAYLILTDQQLQAIGDMADRTLDIAALTNSLATNDLVTNHSGYARWRPAMLEQGIELHELRPDAPACQHWVAVSAACQGGEVSLHSKAVVLDRKTLFVGSFNVNLRSIYLNGETALVIQSPELASSVAEDIRYAMEPENSWRVELDSAQGLVWHSEDGNTDHEPEVGFWRRAMSRMLSWLPIEKYL
ncbi:phospholipase D family protein [Marinobacter sp. F3R08]|uniref:phospholipase D family protein n=1 Tax=Marinobacter sp. F3R08 TaxID=2841559 RepID=UPI001C087FB2|nr:phospholipase D family protein [Marinobacter sp. F3R08]MBU2954317.1 phospholipase D family protein [Marinobacter sp. F3R08]